jgi:hypothetical protein
MDGGEEQEVVAEGGRGAAMHRKRGCNRRPAGCLKVRGCQKGAHTLVSWAGRGAGQVATVA